MDTWNQLKERRKCSFLPTGLIMDTAILATRENVHTRRNSDGKTRHTWQLWFRVCDKRERRQRVVFFSIFIRCFSLALVKVEKVKVRWLIAGSIWIRSVIDRGHAAWVAHAGSKLTIAALRHTLKIHKGEKKKKEDQRKTCNWLFSKRCENDLSKHSSFTILFQIKSNISLLEFTY